MMVFVIGCASGSKQAAEKPAVEEPAGKQVVVVAEGDAEMVAKIDEFLAVPVEVDAKELLERVSKDSKVAVMIPGGLMELISRPGVDEDATALLLVGFIAGDARTQYASGVKGDDLVAGLRGVLTVYASLNVSLPQLDEVAKHEREGTLPAWADAWKQAHPPEAE